VIEGVPAPPGIEFCPNAFFSNSDHPNLLVDVRNLYVAKAEINKQAVANINFVGVIRGEHQPSAREVEDRHRVFKFVTLKLENSRYVDNFANEGAAFKVDGVGSSAGAPHRGAYRG